MTLRDFLIAAHANSLGVGPDPVPGALGVLSRAEVTAEIARIEPSSVRSHVQRVHLAALRRLLERMDD